MYFIFGLIFGSFLNVLTYRLPLNESLVRPPSHCPSCSHRLSIVDLLPVGSYALLRGRCRYCGCKISWRYPAVELLTGLVFLLLGLKHQLQGALIPYLVLSSLLIVISFIDLDHFYIPDKLLLTGVVFWAGLRVFLPFITLRNAFLGATLGYAIMLLIYLGSRGGMGFGDVKLAALIGLYLGPAPVILTLLLSFVVGAVAGISLIALKIRGRKDMLPFGPFLALGAYISMVWGPVIIKWYTAMVGL
ncbi:MAG: leader peptidase (prepilin peptidase) / N-methyltransferase [Bacillota bacterium]|nr:MAG: leader peptidase (prepilin peptidase) / N-methyltransferase [Bacillota bacterium]